MVIQAVKRHGCRKLTDLSPLADAHDLKELTIPESAVSIDFLHALPKLERLGYWEEAADGSVVGCGILEGIRREEEIAGSCRDEF